MTLRDWIGTFGEARSKDINNDLERGYEAALLIQTLELEYYDDRPIRPTLQLSVPRSLQATILRKFRAALNICRSTFESIKPNISQLDSQEFRQVKSLHARARQFIR